MRAVLHKSCFWFILFALAVYLSVANAALTPAQLQTLKTDINADGSLGSLPMTSASALFIAAAYNAQASPSFTVWRSSVGIMLVGKAMRSTDVAALTTANTNRLQVMAAFSGGTFDPANQDTWDGFNDIFSVAGAAQTRANLLAIRKRLATRAEKLFATGTGSDASPATLGFEGLVTSSEVQLARELP